MGVSSFFLLLCADRSIEEGGSVPEKYPRKKYSGRTFFQKKSVFDPATLVFVQKTDYFPSRTEKAVIKNRIRFNPERKRKMKLLFTALVLAAVLPVIGDDIRINGEFKGSKLDAMTPRSWIKQGVKNKDIGISKVVPDKEKDEFALHVKTTKADTSFFSSATVPVKGGETVEVEADVVGKGNVTFQLYTYAMPGHKYISTLPVRKLLSGPGKWKGVIRLPAKINFAYFRLAFTVKAHSDVTISDIEAEFEDKK